MQQGALKVKIRLGWLKPKSNYTTHPLALVLMPGRFLGHERAQPFIMLYQVDLSPQIIND
jgi:hypothetical protein